MSKKTKRTNVPISFRKRNQNVLVSFPIWSRIRSPGPNRNELFGWDKLGNELKLFGFIYKYIAKNHPSYFRTSFTQETGPNIFRWNLWNLYDEKYRAWELSHIEGRMTFLWEGAGPVGGQQEDPHPSSLTSGWSLAKHYSSRMTTGWGIRRMMSRRTSYVDVRYVRVS